MTITQKQNQIETVKLAKDQIIAIKIANEQLKDQEQVLDKL